MSPYLPGGVSDGKWHTLQLHYYNKVRVPQLSPNTHGSLSPQVALALLFSGSVPWQGLWREGRGGFQPLGMDAMEQTAGYRDRLTLRASLEGCRNVLHAVSLPMSLSGAACWAWLEVSFLHCSHLQEHS